MRWASLLLSFLLSLPPLLAEKGTPAGDGAIHDQVMMKLAGDAEVKGGGIDVDVQNGVVTLKGRVDSNKQKDKASRLAKKVKGVTQVENHLVVGPPK
jgi:hyperosmotically inducible protein